MERDQVGKQFVVVIVTFRVGQLDHLINRAALEQLPSCLAPVQLRLSSSQGSTIMVVYLHRQSP